MSYIDYGVIAKKNGKVLNTELFTPMVETIGVTYKRDNEGIDIDGNYFIFLGDKDFYVSIYKGYLKFFKEDRCIGIIPDLCDYDYKRYKRFRHKATIEGVDIDIKRYDDINRYYLRFIYKGDVYEAIYGYGVDTDKDYWYGKDKKMYRFLDRFLKEK